MIVRILSISSILLGVYLFFIYLKSVEQSKPFPEQFEHHMGCFSPDNHANHSSSIMQFLAEINTQSQLQVFQGQSFALATRSNYNEISKEVARDFENYLNEYYQIKTKSVYEQNFYRSLGIAEQKFQTCKERVNESLDKQQLIEDWNRFHESKQKYEQLKTILKQKISRKQRQEQKIQYLILGTKQPKKDLYERNLTAQISTLNLRLEKINTLKIQILAKKPSIELFIATNRTRLQEDQKVYEGCIKNMKIINFCNELTKELNTIKFTFSKQDIQTKIQRKKIIIESFKNAIRNDEKIGNTEMVKISRESLEKNQRQLELLMASIESFQSFEESYCSKCSAEKITQLRLQIKSNKQTIARLQKEYDQYFSDEENLSQQAVKVSQMISNIEQQRDLHINGNNCATSKCQEQRSEEIKDLGRFLNEMKKQVLDYKFKMEQHQIQHTNRIKNMNEWTSKMSALIDCLNHKQYYQSLRNKTPEQSQQYKKQIDRLESKLVQKLKALGHSTTA